jgi:hypothetical protein
VEFSQASHSVLVSFLSDDIAIDDNNHALRPRDGSAAMAAAVAQSGNYLLVIVCMAWQGTRG